MTIKQWLVVLSFASAVFFFLLAAFAVTLGDVDLIPAGLTATAAGLLIWNLPKPPPA